MLNKNAAIEAEMATVLPGIHIFQIDHNNTENIRQPSRNVTALIATIII